MVEKKEVSKEEPVEKRHFLMKGSVTMEKDVKPYLIPGEHVVYQAEELFFTDRRIIKHKHNWFARSFHFFYSTFEDLDYKFIESIKAKNVINLKLLFWGLLIMLLGPVTVFIGSIPGLGKFGEFIMTYFVEGLGVSGLFLIGFVLIIAAVILRDRIIEFHGTNTVLRTKHFHDDELMKVRELQHVLLRRIRQDK